MSKLKIHSKKAEVIEFSWKGTGTVPTVEMRWRNRRVKFDCPVAMMFAYQELEKDLEDEIKVAEAQMALRKEFEKEIRFFEQIGCELKSLEPGLVDFYGERQGELIYLCWREDESSVDWWHSLSGGFSGRQLLT